MMTTRAKIGLILLGAFVLAGGISVWAYPLPSEKQAGEKQTAPAKSQERTTETQKPASDKALPTDVYGDPLPSDAIARLGTVRFRHGGPLEDVVISPDGRRLISAGDRSIDFWDAQTGRRQRQIDLSGSPYRIAGIDLSPDGKLLALHYQQIGNKMRFWDLSSGAEVHPFGEDAPGGGRGAFSPDGNLLAHLDAGNQRTVSIWDMRKGKKIRTIAGGERTSWFVRSLAFSPNGKLLAFPRGTGVCVWDLAAGKELFQLDSGTKWSMGGTVFSADGKRLAAASNPYERGTDYTIHLWNVETGKEAGALKGHEGSIWSLAIASKGNLLASTSFDRTIRFWDLTKQREIGRISGPNRVSRALSFSADGSVLASGHIFGDLHLWDARTYKEIATPAAGSTFVEWVRFAPDGQTLISAAPEQIGLWEPLTGRQRRVFSSKSLVTGGLFWHPSLSPDGKYLATGSDRTQGQALLWDVADGKLVRKFGESGQLRVYSVMFSPDGRRLAGTSYEPNITHIWDAAGGKELLQLKGQNLPHALAFSPDGATLAVSSGWANTDMTVGLWNLATGREIWRKTTRPWLAMDVQFSPDGRTLALVGAMPGRINTKGEFHLWEAATGKELKQIEGHQLPVHCLAFSADGRMLATGSNDNAVHLWEIGSGGERRCFQGHQNHIWALSFSPDGRLLASASGDTTALVWDLTDNFRDGRFQPRRLSAAELARCWNDLALSDAGRAYRSILSLIGSPKETTTFLKDHVPPVIAADPKRVAPLLAALDSEKFAERDKAMIELEKLGLAVESSLRAALSAKPSLEIRQRIEAILEKLAGEPRLRFLRALEVLEHIATPEARQLVEALSRGTAELWPAQEAKASLARLAARPALQP